MRILLLILLAGVAESRPAPGESVVLQVKILAKEPEANIVSLDAGRQAGISLGDSFWIIDNAQMCGFGTIYFITETACVGRFLYSSSDVPCSATAQVLLNKSYVDLRHVFPPGGSIRGRISRLTEKSDTVWIDVGRSTGLQLKDTILIRRENIPIARGEVKILESDAAMVTVQRLVGNASSEMGDAAELWPAPGERGFRMNSTVLEVRPAKEGDEITIVGNAEDGFAEDRLVDIFRDGQFVGVASIIKTERVPLSRAKIIEAASRDKPREGDLAYVRRGAGPPLPPLSAPIFHVVQDYCLVAAGEVDGVQREEKLVVYAEGSRKVVAEITVEKVNVTYSGCSIHLLDPAAGPLPPKSFAERLEPHRPRWESIGHVKTVDSRWRLGVIGLDSETKVEPGRVLGMKAKDPASTAVGIVLAPVRDGLLVYVPPGWGEIDHLKDAVVELGENLDAASQPVESVPE